MRFLITLLTTISGGCSCQEYHLVDLPTTHADYTVRDRPTHATVIPPDDEAPVPRSRPTVPRLRPPGHATPPDDDGASVWGPLPAADDDCTEKPANVDTAVPESPYAAPRLLPGTCVSSVPVTWRSGAVKAAAGGQGVGWLDVPKPGTYHLYAPPLGGTGLLRVPTVDRPGGRPLHANCGTDWVARPSADAVDGVLVYLGTFTLEAGPNPVQLRAGCDVADAVGCAVDGASCGAVELRGAEVCLIAVP